MIHWCAVAGKLGSADDASLPLFVGDGSAGLEWQLVGAVAIGESANAVLVELVLSWMVLELGLVMALLVHHQLVMVLLLALQSVLLQCW